MSVEPSQPKAELSALVRRHWANALFVALALGILCWVSWDAVRVRSVTYEGGSDYWEHSAALHALIESPWHPRNPHLESNVSSPRFGPQFLLIALVARTFRLDAIAAMSLTAVLNTLLFLGSIRVFFATYFRSQLAPLYGLLVMFAGWWHGPHYSNAYQLNVFFSVATYPSTTALGLTLLGFALAVRILRAEVRRPRLALGVLTAWAATVFIIHPLTAVMSLSGLALLAVSEPKAPLRVRLEVVAAVVIGSALSRFWPYFSPWEVVAGGHGATAGWAGQSIEQAAALQIKRQRHEFYHWDALAGALGLSWLAIAGLPYFLRKRERWFVGLGALSMLIPFAINAFIDLPLGHRFLLLAMVYLHIGVVWLLLLLSPGFPGAPAVLEKRWAKLSAASVVAAVLLVFGWHSAELAREQLDNPKFYSRPESPVISNARAFAAAAGPGAVVLSTPLVSWPLPSFGPKVVVLFHDHPLVPDEPSREYAVSRFLAHASDEERLQTIRRFGVTHVLLAREQSGSLARFLAENATVRLVGTGYRLYTLSASARKI